MGLVKPGPKTTSGTWGFSESSLKGVDLAGELLLSFFSPSFFICGNSNMMAGAMAAIFSA